MMGKTHALAGGVFAAAITPPAAQLIGVDFGPAELAAGVGIGTVAGLLPDIDHPNSLLTKGILPGSKYLGPIGKVAGYALSIPPRIVGVGARATMNHRGGTHSILFMILWTFLAAPLYALVAAAGALVASIILDPLAEILPVVPTIDVGAFVHWLWAALPGVMPLVSISVFSGYLAHLITDSMTKVPVPWPWPLSQARWHILPKPFRITTGDSVETLLIRPLFAAALAALVVFQIGVPAFHEVIDKGEAVIRQDDGSSKKPHGKGHHKAKRSNSGRQHQSPGVSRYDQR